MENITTKTPTSTSFDISSSVTDDYDYETYQEHIRIANIIHIFSMFIYAVAFVFGTIGNGLVIWITGFKMKKTVNTVWFLNLAIADFIFTFFLPLSIAYIALGFHWPFGKLMCKINSTIAFLNLFASVFLLTVISMDRCISVVLPVWSQNHRTPNLASVVALVVWCLALIVSSPYFAFRDIKVQEDVTYCYNNYAYSADSTNENDETLVRLRYRAQVITRFILGFFIPFIVIVSCYTVIALRLHMNNLATSTKPFKIIVAVLISFFVCWFPYQVLSFVELSNYPADDFLSKVVFIGVPITSSLAFLNSCVNPFLYVFVGRDFRKNFRRSILSIFEGAFSEDSVPAESKDKTTSTSVSNVV
ncbi:chemerin-like receptor 1 [Ascaphus truei]|uniref:chemerin-like receptor 1 n=1 Tax=Ascaphus truei TaxID=8439 RepID=UPI003F59CE27